MNNTQRSYMAVLLATGALLSNAGCGGDSNDPVTQSGAGTSSDDAGGSKVGGAGGSSGKSPGGGRSGAGSSSGGSDEGGGATAGGTNAGGSTAGSAGKPSTTCDRDADCVTCAYDKAPATKTECYCVTCASTAMSKAQCAANQAHFEKICADVVLPCPAIRCLPPADPVCESNMCLLE